MSCCQRPPSGFRRGLDRDRRRGDLEFDLRSRDRDLRSRDRERLPRERDRERRFGGRRQLLVLLSRFRGFDGSSPGRHEERGERERERERARREGERERRGEGVRPLRFGGGGDRRGRGRFSSSFLRRNTFAVRSCTRASRPLISFTGTAPAMSFFAALPRRSALDICGATISNFTKRCKPAPSVPSRIEAGLVGSRNGSPGLRDSVSRRPSTNVPKAEPLSVTHKPPALNSICTCCPSTCCPTTTTSLS
mmetsp:Transcript_40757/g.95215  ORF Transcript_40757/g.95215 Transcript_40757/m.95215 type:complete len:250 (+) Transcript_40757:54-803(+)